MNLTSNSILRSVALVALAIGCFRTAALAQDGPREYVEPRIARPLFSSLVRDLGLDADQRSFAEMMFNDYSVALDDITASLEARANEAGLKLVQDVLAGRARLSVDETRAKRVAIHTIYQDGWPLIDQAQDQLLHGIELLLTDAQIARYQTELRELRRKLLLHPRQADREYPRYAGDGVDVLLLVQAAQQPGGELAALPPASLDAIVAMYELHLDALLRQHANAFRYDKLMRKIATIERDSAALAELDRAALARWQQLYQLNLDAVQQIGAIAAAHVGEPARQPWTYRFDRACFEWLYPRKRPERQIEWMRQQSLPAESLEKAEDIFAQYTARRHELSRQAIDIMLRARMEFQMLVYSMMDPPGPDDRLRKSMYDELLKNSGEQTSLENATVGALEALLNPTQREAMRKMLQQADRRR